MIVTRKSVWSGKTNTMELPVTQEQLDRYFEGNELIQNVFPRLNASQREFILTGASLEEQDNIFGKGKDEVFIIDP